MKRSFVNAILCFAVVAMLVGTAQAVTNIDPLNTVGCWTFDDKTPGETPAAWPPTLGSVTDLAGGDNNATLVGRYYGNLLGDDDVNNPANYFSTAPTYVGASSPYGSAPSGLHMSYSAFNETGLGVPPLCIQSRVECPATENANWDLMVGDGGDYTIEAVIKPQARDVDEGGYDGLKDRTDFYEGIVADHTLVRPSDGSGIGANWFLRTTGSDVGATGLQFVINPGWKSTETPGDLHLLDGNWHHVAVVVNSDEVAGVGTTTVKIYCDNLLKQTGTFSDVANTQPLDDYPPPYDNPTTDAMWIGDFLGRWDDQFIGDMDGVAFTRAALLPGMDPVAGNFVLNRAPEPSSIVLLVMGALALLAIRRVR